MSELWSESPRPQANPGARLWAELWAVFAGRGWSWVSEEEPVIMCKDRYPRNADPPLAKHSPRQDARAAVQETAF